MTKAIHYYQVEIFLSLEETRMKSLKSFVSVKWKLMSCSMLFIFIERCASSILVYNNLLTLNFILYMYVLK